MSETFEEWKDRQGDNCCLIEAAWFDQQSEIDTLQHWKDESLREIPRVQEQAETIKNLKKEFEREHYLVHKQTETIKKLKSVIWSVELREKKLKAQLNLLTQCTCATTTKSFGKYGRCDGCNNKDFQTLKQSYLELVDCLKSQIYDYDKRKLTYGWHDLQIKEARALLEKQSKLTIGG